MILQYTQTQNKFRLLFLSLCDRPFWRLPRRKSFSSIFSNSKRFELKKLHHVSYLLKGYLWTKGQRNWFFDFCREIQILLGFWWHLLLISHFRVRLCLCLKTSPSANLKYQNYFCMQFYFDANQSHFHIRMVSHLE